MYNTTQTPAQATTTSPTNMLVLFSKKARQIAWKRLAEHAKPKGIDVYKYCATAKLKEDPLTLQKNGAMSGNKVLMD